MRQDVGYAVLSSEIDDLAGLPRGVRRPLWLRREIFRREDAGLKRGATSKSEFKGRMARLKAAATTATRKRDSSAARIAASE